MVLRTTAGRPHAESTDDLERWLAGLSGCPEVHRTVVSACANASHDEPATWFYVEADPAEGVARWRCLACARRHALLDSDDRWTFPTGWSCRSCSQPIAEVAHGLHVEDGRVTWVVTGVRCVNCGDVAGVTDAIVPRRDVDEILATL